MEGGGQLPTSPQVGVATAGLVCRLKTPQLVCSKQHPHTHTHHLWRGTCCPFPSDGASFGGSVWCCFMCRAWRQISLPAAADCSLLTVPAPAASTALPLHNFPLHDRSLVR